MSGKAPESRESRASSSKFGRGFQFVRRHPVGVLQVVFFALIVTIVLQNLEPTSIDVLFWSLAGLPKLVLIVLSMVTGAAAWELVHRWFRG